MSRKDAVLIVSRGLAVLFTVSALVELSYLPQHLHSYLHYTYEAGSSIQALYLRHSYLIELGFLITRIVGFFLMGAWLRRGGSDIQEMLLPEPEQS